MSWIFAPGIVLPLVAAMWLYAHGAARGRGVSWRDALCFAGGWLALVAALVSPLHPLGEVLFSAHMVQHEILMIIAAPLLVLGRPLAPMLWGMPAPWRRTAGRWARRVLLDPLGAWALHAAVIWGWHAPVLFEATLRSDAVHALQHISFLGSALLFWWALFERRMTYGASVLYIFTTAIHTSALGVLLTFAPTIWYPAYAARTSAMGIAPLDDQQIAGLIMWIPAGLVYTAVGVALFAAWMRESDASLARKLPRPAGGLLLAALVACLPMLSSCGPSPQQAAATMTGGDPAKGVAAIGRYGCGTCHAIAGIRDARGKVGPPLTGIASRMYVAGMLENRPRNLQRWIRNPKEVNPGTAMPVLGVNEADARDISSYLYTLR